MGLPQAQLAIGFRAHVNDGPLIVDRLDPAGAFPESLLGRASSRLRQVHTRVCVCVHKYSYTRFVFTLWGLRNRPAAAHTYIHTYIHIHR